MNLIRCRQCGETEDRDLYMEDLYHDVTCMVCGARSGKYGDENEAIDKWNGKGIRFHVVMWMGPLHGKMLEMWDSRATAEARAKYFNKMISDGKSPLGYKIDLTRGIREIVSVDSIEPNIEFEGVDSHGNRKP